MNRQQKEARQCKGLGFWSRCCNGVSLFLGITLALQLAVAGFLYFQERFPLPQYAKDQVNDYLADVGLKITWEDGAVDLTGDMRMRNIKLIDKATNEPYAHIDEAILSLDLLYLLAGNPRIQHLGISGLECYCPAVLSESGVAEVIFSNGHLDLKLNDGKLEFRRSSISILDTPVYLTGSFEPSRLSTKPVKAADYSQVRQRYAEFAQSVSGGLAIREQIEAPVVQVAVTGSEVDWSVQVATKAKRASIDKTAHIELPEVLVDISSAGEAVLTVTAGSVTAPELGILQQVAIQSQPVSVEMLSQLRYPDATLTWGEAEAQGDSWGAGRLALSQLNLTSFYTDLVISKDTGWIAATAIIDAFKQRALIEAELRLPGNTVCALPLVNESEFPDVFNMHGTPFLAVQVTLEEGFAFHGGDFQLITGSMDFRDAPMDGMLVAGFVSLDEVRVEDISLRRRDWMLRGSYYENFNDSRFRILLDGDIRPVDLNPLLDDWWDELWTYISFDGEHPPLADIDVYGYWNNPIDRSVYGYISGDKMRFQGLALDNAKAYLRVDGVDDIKLFDMHLHNEQGTASGWLQWYLPIDDNSLNRLFEFESTLPFKDVAPIMHSDLLALNEIVDFKQPPQMHIHGMIKQESQAGREVYKIPYLLADSRGPIDITGTQASHARLEGSWQGDRFKAYSVSLEYPVTDESSGNLNGTLDVLIADEPSMDFSFESNNVPLQQLYHFTDYLQGKDAPEQPEESVSGIIHGHISGSTDMATTEALKADGHIIIQQAALQNITTLGGLSRTLDKIGLKFTTIRLTNAEGEFSIADNVMHFPDLAISGDRTLIRASGKYGFDKGSLDMRVNIYPAEHITKTPLALLKTLTTPLGNAFEMMLFGTIDDPKYRLTVDPRNLIGNPVEKQRREAEAQDQATSEQHETEPKASQ